VRARARANCEELREMKEEAEREVAPESMETRSYESYVPWCGFLVAGRPGGKIIRKDEFTHYGWQVERTGKGAWLGW
jgi:hypothetical protein